MYDLYFELKKANIRLGLKDGQLDIQAPKGVMTGELLNRIREGKEDLIAILQNEEAKNIFAPIGRAPESEGYVLSSSQRRLWILSQFEGGSSAYHLGGAYTFHGALDAAALARALHALATRHESLRTTFAPGPDGQPLQYIHPANSSSGPALKQIDLRAEADSEAAARAAVQANAEAPFDLERGPLLRVVLLQLPQDTWVLGYALHHLISDGWSMPILLRELLTLYNACAGGSDEAQALSLLPPLPIQYKDYAYWQQQQLRSGALAADRAYWLARFKGEVPVLQLPQDAARPAVRRYEGAVLHRQWSSLGGFAELVRQQGATLFMGLLAVVEAVLYRYSGQEDLVVGTPIAGRSHADVQDGIGFYVNTLALRTRVAGGEGFRNLLTQVRQACLEGYEHQGYPFDELVEEIGLRRDTSRHPLFDVMMVLQQAAHKADKGAGLAGVQGSGFEEGGEAVSSKFDLSFVFTEVGEGLSLLLEYDSALYEPARMERLCTHLEGMLQAVTAHPDEALDNLDYLSSEERTQLVDGFNQTSVAYPKEATLVSLFEQSVESHSSAIALVHGDEQVSYAQLNDQANAIAHYLIEEGIKSDELVGICLERGVHLIAALLGVLKAGGGYVPIDPDYPQERIRYMIEDSGCRLVLTSAAVREQLPSDLSTLILDIHEVVSQPINQNKIQRARAVQPNDLAYIIYTSGSTGRPKGVLIEHHSVVAFLHWCRQEFSGDGFDILYAVTSVCFDLSIFEIFYPLITGKKIRILENGLAIRNYLSADQHILINTVPSVMRLLLTGEADLSGVVSINMAGEPIGNDILDKLPFDQLIVRNLYGPTEDTTYSTVYRLRAGHPALIGKPISNTRAFVLDRNGALCPVGIPGEIFLDGDGLARGYHHQPELTAERFVHKTIEDRRHRLYATGDSGSWHADGNLEYLGRLDHQVKLRGYRIELGEIENALREIAGVDRAVVVVQGEGATTQLAAFVISAAPPDSASLIAHLQKRLPAYMVPARFVFPEAIPLTPNGKVDRKALEQWSEEEGGASDEELVPEDEGELKLLDIWKKLLKKEYISLSDDFFGLGGHSLLAAMLVSAIRKEMHLEIPLMDVFTYPTVRSLYRNSCQKVGVGTALPEVEAQEWAAEAEAPLSFAQERLWFIDRLQGSVHYHIPAVFSAPPAFDAPTAGRAFAAVVARHQALRTVFPTAADGTPYQRLLPAEGWQPTLLDVTEEDAPAHIEALLSTPFDLSRDYPLRLALLRTPARWLVVVVLHHIAADGWSLGLLESEFVTLYRAALEGTEPALPALPVQYRDYALWQRRYLSGPVLQRQLDYWGGRLAGVEPLALPADHPRPPVQGTAGATRTYRLEPELIAAVRTAAQRHQVTLFMYLLAGCYALLRRHTGQQDLCVGTPVAGRTRQALEGLIGFFVNTLALRTSLAGDPSFAELLQRVRTTTLEAYHHQDVPFEQVVDRLNPERDLSRTPVFQVLFALQNTPAATTRGPLQAGVALQGEAFAEPTAKFDLNFDLHEEASGGVTVRIEYATDLFEAATVDRLFAHYRRLLAGSLHREGSVAVSRLPLLSSAERSELLETLAGGRADYGQTASMTVASLFEAQAARTPSAVALRTADGAAVSYAALEAAANRLARHLAGQGVMPGALVGLCVERSAALVVGLLAIYKAGAGYVPLDAAYPPERLAYLMGDSGCAVVVGTVATRALLAEVLPAGVRLVAVDEPAVAAAIEAEAATPLLAVYDGEQPGYLIYTSGSTGRPKGVELSMASLVNLLLWQQAEVGDDRPAGGGERCVLQFASIGFDASFQELFFALCFGGSVQLIGEQERKDFGRLLAVVEESDVTHLFLPYVVVQGLAAEAVSRGRYPQGLRRVFTAGEQLKLTAELEAFFAGSGAGLSNYYGPSETHVVSAYDVRAEDYAVRPLAPIGRAVGNTRLYVLGPDGELSPRGAVGELYIGGVQVGRGYRHLAQLTAERFVADPFEGSLGGRMYRSGDQVRWSADGALEFLGRNDDQVKIRGNRVELGEVEGALLGSGVRQCVVASDRDGQGYRRLVAYVVLEEGQSVDGVRAALSGRLPEYMVPSVWMELEGLPLNANGKVERGRLPAAEAGAGGRESAYVAPQGAVAERLAALWGELLGVERVGARDNFFHLGGHSLLATRVIAKIREEFHVDINVRDFFNQPTIEALAKDIARRKWAQEHPLSDENDDKKLTVII